MVVVLGDSEQLDIKQKIDPTKHKRTTSSGQVPAGAPAPKSTGVVASQNLKVKGAAMNSLQKRNVNIMFAGGRDVTHVLRVMTGSATRLPSGGSHTRLPWNGPALACRAVLLSEGEATVCRVCKPGETDVPGR
jgi:hypothetical protein